MKSTQVTPNDIPAIFILLRYTPMPTHSANIIIEWAMLEPNSRLLKKFVQKSIAVSVCSLMLQR